MVCASTVNHISLNVFLCKCILGRENADCRRHMGKRRLDLSVKAVDKTAQGQKLEDTRIETGKSYTYMGRKPDGSEVPIFIIKDSTIFVGASNDAVRLVLNWSVPENNVQILEVPVESGQMITETPVPTPTAQATPTAPGFEMVIGIIGILIVRRMLTK
jgi:hypothetical protein